jgi:U3 small nucleolar RNA-associated protein 12
MRTVLIPLRTHLREALQRQKEEVGYNLAALRYIKRGCDAERTAEFYGSFRGEGEAVADEEALRAKISEGKKRKRVSVKV